MADIPQPMTWQEFLNMLPTIPNWGISSDHRPAVATFEAGDK